MNREAAKRGAGTPDAALEALSEAIEAGSGLPAVARAAGKVLGASVALIDRSSSVLAVAAGSPAEEAKLLAGEDDVSSVELRVADEPVGQLRYRPRGDAEFQPSLARVVAALLGLEVERARSPQWASEEATSGFVRAVLAREVTDRDDLIARGAELGANLEAGGGVVIVRVSPTAPQTGEWRSRALTLSLRALSSSSTGAILALEEGEVAEIAAIVPTEEIERLERAAKAVSAELSDELSGFTITAAYSRLVQDPVDFFRAGQEARLALNVAEAEGRDVLAFEDTGSYRLLLGAMSEDARELERFYQETVEPLSVYDEQYETELVVTVETYLENDGNVAATAQQLFTHRHTIRYRLERVRELSGHDLTSTEGRERMGLGLKAMRVLGIASPRGPAHEPGAEAGKVPRSGEE